MKFSIKLNLLIVAMALCAGGCAKKSVPEPLPAYQYLIGVSQANLVEPWRIAVHDELISEAQNYSDTKLIFTDAAGQNERQQADVDRLLSLGIDLLIISPNDAQALKSTIQNANEQIPVIVLDSDISDAPYALFIGPDNKKIGLLAGQTVAELLNGQGITMEIIAMESTGLAQSPPSVDISQGFKEALAGFPGITIKEPLKADWLKDTADSRMKSFLLRKEPVDIIFAHNDAMSVGAYNAEKEYGEALGIRYIGVNGLKDEGEKYVKNGVLACTVSRPTGAKEALTSARQILSGDTNLQKKILLNPAIILPES